jgi:hypothetical protein
MANILNLITIGEKKHYVVDADPSTGGGLSASLGDIAVYDNGTNGFAYIKTGVLDTAWQQFSTSAASGTVNNGTAGFLSLYAATGNAVSDTYVQNSQNIKIDISSQPTRSAGLTYNFPNPGDAVASADVVLTEGAQTINGSKTFSSTIIGHASLDLALTGGTMSGAIAMGTNKITGLGNPTTAQDAATKAYVDNVALGIKPKQSVRAATTGNITIATALNNGSIIDGVTLATGDRVLVKDQSAPANNGIYIVDAVPFRSTDFDQISAIDEINGAWMAVQEGTTNAGKVFIQYGVVSTLGVDPINFTIFNDLSTLIGGDMITVSGSTVSVDLATVSGLESSNPGNVAGQLRVKLEASNPSLQIDGSNQLGAKLNASGAIVKGASGLAVQLESSNPSLQISSNQLGAKLNAAGAIITGASGLAVQVDNSTIDIATNSLEVKAGGITNTQINTSAAIALTKLAALTANKLLVSDGSGFISASTSSGFVKTTTGTPAYQSSISLTTDVSGTLPIANGGTNNTTFPTNGAIYFNGTSLIGDATDFIAYDGAGHTGIGGASNASFALAVTGSSTFSAAPTIATFTLGSVVFAGASGLLSQDNTNFFWDNTNKRLGLKTASPSRTLDINGNAQVQGPFKIADSASANANIEWLQAQVNTTDATTTTIATLTVPSGQSTLVEARIIGRRTGGTAGSSGDSATYVRTARFKNVAGTITINSLQSDFTSEDQFSWDGTMAIVGGAAVIRVTGATNNNVSWAVTYSVQTL